MGILKMLAAALDFLKNPDGLALEAKASLPLFGLRPDEAETFLSDHYPHAVSTAKLNNFAAQAGHILLLPNKQGDLAGAALGLGTATTFSAFGAAASTLPNTINWDIQTGQFSKQEAELGFMLGAYRYQSQKTNKGNLARLASVTEHSRIVAGSIMMARELINMPANLLGPKELADAAEAIARRFKAPLTRLKDDALKQHFPSLYAVGCGSDRAPEAVILRWRGNQADNTAPLVSLCGKGVCFDTGGYNIKPDASMRFMRKDMGGAAVTLGLANAIMALDLKLRLEVRIGCVENSISGHAMRPSDILQTRAGISVEVGNTDAEGRLVLCDLLNEACEANPDWLIDIATLTGAARVALGPDLPALLSNNDKMADIILNAGKQSHDPLWRLPLHEPYAAWLSTPFADLCNISSKPFAGAITAALFLQHFIPASISWSHIDTYAWNDTTRPGKPEGGEAQPLRALLAAVTSLANNAS